MYSSNSSGTCVKPNHGAVSQRDDLCTIFTCPGCTQRSTPSCRRGKSLCWHGGPDSQGPAASPGTPVGPAQDFVPSCCAGSGLWWRPEPPLDKDEQRGEHEESWINCWVFSKLYKSVYLCWHGYMHCTWCQGVRALRIRLAHLRPLCPDLGTPRLHWRESKVSGSFTFRSSEPKQNNHKRLSHWPSLLSDIVLFSSGSSTPSCFYITWYVKGKKKHQCLKHIFRKETYYVFYT